MSLPALPSAQQMTPALVRDYSAQVVAWAEQTEDAEQVRDMSNKWAAMTEYVRRTSREGVAEAEAALRRLEVRVGVLLGPATDVGGRPRKETVDRDQRFLRREDRTHFRAMAEHPDVVEAVIAESSDASPPSRNKVLNAIKAVRASEMEDTEEGDDMTSTAGRTRDENARRIEHARKLAAQGHTSQQIAERMGISRKGIWILCNRHGIDVPADRVVGKRQAIAAERIIDEAVATLEAVASTFTQIEDVSSLDAAKRLDWLDAIAEPLAAITRFKKELSK